MACQQDARQLFSFYPTIPQLAGLAALQWQIKQRGFSDGDII